MQPGIIVLLVLLLGFSHARAQDGGFWPDINWLELEKGARELAKEFDLELPLPPPGMVAALLTQAETLVREGTWEDFARFAPQARALHGFLRQDEALRPYLDWLDQRLDYFSFAEELLRPPPPPPTPPPGRVQPTPTPRPPVRQRVDDRAAWQRRAQQRPVPRGAAEWVPRLKPVFIQEGLPPQLIWLAEVESSFNPAARSPVGAKGLFQFMPATAESLGLKLAPTDERTDPEKSARAAAKYLRQLYGRFGDWPLVLAAYNAGQGRVGGLVRRHGASFEAISAYLPAETRMFVPKVLATVEAREGMNAANLPAPRP